MLVPRRILGVEKCMLIALAAIGLILVANEVRGWTDEKGGSAEKRHSLQAADERVRSAAGAGGLVGVGQPLTAAALLQAGNGFSLWTGLPENPIVENSKVPPLVNLESVQDETPVRSGEEGLAFCEAVVKAHKTSNQVFHNSVTHGLTYANLYQEPKLHRGKVVHFEGTLRRLVRFEPPEETKLDGVTDLYEGWIFIPNYGANPVCVRFTELPQGLEPGDQLNVRASFDGYFFKRYRYKAADTWRDAPLLIGHTIVVTQAPAKVDAEETGSWSSLMAITFLLVLGCVFFLALALTMWYRRNDRIVQSRLINAQASSFVPSELLPLEEENKPAGHTESTPGN